MAFGEEQLLECARVIMKPAVSFCLRHGLSIQQMVELLKQIVVRIASEELEAAGEKSNTSRLSAMTGLHRRDVERLRTDEQTRPVPAPLAARVAAQWENDSRFIGLDKRPRALSIASENNEFHKLLGALNTDLNPGTVLFELERSGMIACSGDTIRLKKRHVTTRKDVLESFRILGQDCDDLANVVEENVSGLAVQLHARTEFDNISLRHVEQLRQWLVVEGGKFHEKVRRRLARYDVGVTPRSGPAGARISLGSFCRVMLPKESSVEEKEKRA